MIGQGNNGNNGWGGCGDGWWILLLLLCGWGGNNGWNNGGGNQMVGYELGKVATQADVASGFNNSAVLSSLNDIKLGQQQAINYNNQGFSGISQAISDCCCQTQRSIDGINYNMARNTCDIIQSGKDNTQRILDYLACKENQELRDQNFALRLQASQSAQNAYLVDQLRPTARPAYITCSPFDSAFGRSNYFGNGCGCGCN
jgi:hypothetical protein